MKDSKQVFLQLIAEGLKENPKPVEAVKQLSKNDVFEILNLAGNHSLLALLFTGLEASYNVGMTDISRCMEEISKYERLTTMALYQIYLACDELSKAFYEEKMTAVVLKGPAVGAYYTMPELRKSGDLDLWIFELKTFKGELYQKVMGILETHGFYWDGEKGSQHHRVFVNSNGLHVEIHTTFCDLFPEKERNTVIDEFQKSIGKESFQRIKLIDRYEFLSLSGGDLIFYNLIHMAQHYYMKGFGWKFICDWAMLFSNPLPQEEEKHLHQWIKDAKMRNFAEAVSLLAVRYFNLDKHHVEFLIDGAVSEETLNEFTEQIFETGEFGTKEKNRLYAPGKDSIKDLFLLFHLQMQKNFEKASKIVLIWPVLWIVTLCKFIYNNKKLRGVSTVAVLKDAKKRGKKAEKMDLFGR